MFYLMWPFFFQNSMALKIPKAYVNLVSKEDQDKEFIL